MLENIGKFFDKILLLN